MKKEIVSIDIYGFLCEDKISELKFVMNLQKHKFLLFVGDTLVAESGFNIEQPDKWFDQKYVILFNVKTIKRFRGQGYAKKLLEHIFYYIKNELKLNIITLLVYKNNYKAVSLYFKLGFEIYIDYDENNTMGDEACYTLIKHL